MSAALLFLAGLSVPAPTPVSTSTAGSTTVAPLPVGADGEVERADPPDVDGRPEREGAGEALLWVPRALLAPLYGLTEYGIRRPVGWLVTTAERERWPTFFLDLFTFGEERKLGLLPTALFDFGFRPSFGFFFFANDAFVKGHDIRVSGAFGGPRWYRLTFTDRWRTWEDGQVEFAFRFLDRPDWQFNGLGPDTLDESRVRYGRRVVSGHVAHRQRFFERLDFRVQLGVEENSFEPGQSVFGDPSLADAVALGLLAQPSGLEGYFVFKTSGALRLDTRQNLRKNGTGLSARLRTEYAVDLNDADRRAWVTNEGGLAGHIDVGRHRILSLAGVAVHTTQIGDAAVPFVELPESGRAVYSLGGFRPGRLVGSSLAAVTLDWRWEVWALADGRVFAQVGNVFGEDFSDFSAERTRLAYGLGVASVLDPGSSFNFLLAVAHQTFEQGAAPEAIRLLFGFTPDL